MSEVSGIIERRIRITPEDGKKITRADGIRVNVSGIVSTRDAKGNLTEDEYVAGVDYPYAVTEVLATNTTATGITALYYT